MKGMAALPTHIRHKLRLKRFIEIQRQRDMMTEYGLKSAMFMLTPADTKFLGKIKAHFRFNIDPKYYDQQLTATVNLPKGTGKSVKVAVLAQGLQLDEAKNAGADFVGGEDLIEQIKGGFMEFDKLIASPDMMPKVADLGMILRPRDLMPTVRNGTVTANILQAITEFKLGRIEYKADKTGTLHLPVGGADFSEEDIFMKFAAAVESMEANKPPGVQGVHWKSARLCASRRGHCVWLIMEELLDYKLPSDIKS
ncbi:50S ribosomal protein L1, chloroplastic-like [Prosopis cineraria]|uniref:50S ribosomal protein L1, chloroplastic-like n=1 Tax=Prosopis cineraria TaxID=364024 RepID=UPI00240F0F36|nr:50S ribosomal protein L1, chloroplastic-like [Prosopis cineraria]